MKTTPAEYWNGPGSRKEFTTEFQLEEFSSFVDSAGAILDVGCGYGRITALLYDAGYHRLCGVDVSCELIARGRIAHPQLDLRIQRPGKLDFLDEIFDAVVLCAVLTCIPSNQGQEELLGEIQRVLKKGGIFYCNDFLLNSDERNIARYRSCPGNFSFGTFQLEDGIMLRHHSEDYLDTLFAAFSSVVYRKVTYRTMNGHTSNGFYYIGRKK